MKSSSEILGVRFYAFNQEDVKKEINESLKQGKQTRIFTPNPDILLKAQKNDALRKALNDGALLLPDGIGIILASRLLGTPLPQRITGIDMGEFIISEAERMGLRLFLLGGERGVAGKAAHKLTKKYPRLNICGTHHGFFAKSGTENEKVLELISKAAPDILFVCFGAPAQEIWVCENATRLPSVKLFAGLGGSLDVWSGNISRAPNFMRRCGLEWLWRVTREPKRAKNLINIPVFIEKILKQRISNPNKPCGV